jgi:flavin reductase (DIM6/NTAB) family NADH-FMN oxidoreductase RutF
VSTSGKLAVPLAECFYLLHPYNSTLVTTQGKEGQPNIMAVAWIIPASTNPPLLALSVRRERYSYTLMQASGEFVVNIPTFDLAKQVLLCGRRSGRQHDKWKEATLTPEKANKVRVPRIKECIAHIECKLERTVEAGDHDLIIGRVVAASALQGTFEHTWNLAKFHPCQHNGKNFFTTCSPEYVEPKLES